MLVRLPEDFVVGPAMGTTLTKPIAGSGWLMGYLMIVQHEPPTKRAVN